MNRNEPTYRYAATILRVVDGDTIEADIDLGFGIWQRKQIIRVSGIDTPELRGEESEQGALASRAMTTLIDDHCVGRRDGWPLIVIKSVTGKRDSFGRWLAELWGEDDEGSELNIGQQLISLGFATKYVG